MFGRPPRRDHRRDACATRTGRAGEAEELRRGESRGRAAAVALGDGFQVLRIDGDVLLVVEVVLEDGEKDIERDALVHGEDEVLAGGGEAFHLLDALENGRTVEPVGEGIDGGVEAARDLAHGLVGIGERDEDVARGLLGGLEVEELRFGGGGR